MLLLLPVSNPRDIFLLALSIVAVLWIWIWLKLTRSLTSRWFDRGERNIRWVVNFRVGPFIRVPELFSNLQPVA
jgi:hypothetical protein